MLSRRLFVFGGLVSLPSLTEISHAASKLTMSKRDHEILSQTVYGEARGEEDDGRYAVCNTIFNRILSDNPLFDKDKTIRNTCLRHKQYSCWNSGYIPHFDAKSKVYQEILEITFDAFKRYKHGHDNTFGATHYHSKHSKPDWISSMKKTTTIDSHIFYKPKKV